MLWGVNSFDQWGVELGKELGGKVLNALENKALRTALTPRPQV